MLSRLVSAPREGEALWLFKERLAVDASLRPQTEEESRRLAQLAREWSDHSAAKALMGNSDEGTASPLVQSE
jgi:hypothetical protein